MYEDGPFICATDIVGDRQQVNDVILYAEMHGARVRYRLHIDSYISQSYFLVEAFSRENLTWNEVWSIAPNTYRIAKSPAESAVIDPASPLIASPYSPDPGTKVRSWQNIVEVLHDHADKILRPGGEMNPTLRLADREGELLTVTAYVGRRDRAAVVEIDTDALGIVRPCRVLINNIPVFAANPDMRNHDVKELEEYVDELLHQRERES